MIEPKHPEISVSRQCELIGLNRSMWYYRPVDESEEDLLAKRLIDEQYTSTPFYGAIEDEGMPAEAGAGHQPQAGNEADAGDGNPGDLSKAQAEHIGQWAQDLPVSFRGLTHRPA